ncbi:MULTISPECIES: immunoglobulin-like domain-containing protein [unclassified Enterococcus]|uniref:immunoglobulin-like domain-containing protein n=1 Tax=unclassified Enterococcus TaxID=2608891 RepID=UPI0013E9ABA4|nr:MULTISPECIES: immunoglobulin-like domain-containing protein [unclassified Enterococcus]
MNYKKTMLFTLLSVSMLGATMTTTHTFAEENAKAGLASQTKQSVAITLNDYVIGRSTNITGTYNGTNAVYMRAEVNGKKEGLVTSKELASGKINYYVGNLKAGDNAQIVLFDKNYQEIGRQKVTLTEPVKTQITLDNYVIGQSTNITGTYNGTNAVYMRAEVNGKKEGLVSSKGLASGKINYYVGNLKAGDDAQIVLFDKNYQEIGRQKVTLTEPVKTQITLDKYVVGQNTEITGTYNGTNAVYMRAEVNGKKEGLVSSKGLASGKINYYVGQLNTGDNAEIVLFDSNYQEIGRQKLTIEGPAQVGMTLDKYYVGRSTNITGTYEGNNAVYMQAEVNGKKEALVQSKELASGKINYYVGNLKQTDKAEIVLFNKSYQEIGRQQVTLAEPVQAKINLENYVIGKSNTITGTYDGTNAAYMRAEINGKKEGFVSSKGLATGKISYYIGNLKQTDNVQIVLFDKNYNEIGRQSVPLSVNQVFNIKGVSVYGEEQKLLISVENQKLNIKENYYPDKVVNVHGGYGNSKYFSIKITGPNNNNIYTHTWIGTDKVSANDLGTYDVPNGSTVEMYHAEGYTRFDTNDNAALRSKTGTNYIYKMENNRLVLVNVIQG